MTLQVDQELLDDFLIEAGEILEQLNEQLIDLEHRPDDMELLNAVFRGFHTIKGGAGFMGLTPVVAVCHRAEDVFNLLRNGQRQVDPELMDVILPVLDVVNEQFDQLRAGETPEEADAGLLQKLEVLSVPGAILPAGEESAEQPAAAVITSSVDADFEQLLDNVSGESSADMTAESADSVAADEITEDEFDALLDKLHGAGGAPGAAETAMLADTASAPSDEITEDEFDALLDKLHGAGAAPGLAKEDGQAKAASVVADEITEDEFDALLDKLHGDGGAPGIKASAPAAVASKTATVTEAPKAANPPVLKEKKPEAEVKDKAAPQAESTVRVDTKRLDTIMNLVGELVLVRNRLTTLQAMRGEDSSSQVVANLDLVTADLQAAVMKTRMQPIKKVFGRFPRVVRDLSRTLKKEVNLELVGEDTDLDKNLVDALSDPLVHLVRNAVDHGIEQPDVREKAGKPRTGTVVLSAQQEGDHILLRIKDDGGGMDADKLRAKAVEKGLLEPDAAARLDNKDCFNLIFAPGFSTKEEISDVSGRGVGMDVVKSRISQLNGVVEIDSELGRGTTLSIKLPLTLAIMPTLMIKLQNQIFALPLVNVNEILNLDLTKTNCVDGQTVIMVREKALPIFYLTKWLIGDAALSTYEEAHVVVVSVGTQLVGLVVDHLIGQEEVVIKPLGALLQSTRGFAGATITGDGKIALIIDLPELMSTYASRI